MNEKTDELGRVAAHYAAAENDVVKLHQILRSGGDVRIADRKGLTPLHLACQQNAFEAVTFLVEHGALVDAADAFGNTPLSTAVFNSRGRGDIIMYLRAKGANPLYANKYRQTPVGLARLIGNYDVAQFFADLP